MNEARLRIPELPIRPQGFNISACRNRAARRIDLGRDRLAERHLLASVHD